VDNQEPLLKTNVAPKGDDKGRAKAIANFVSEFIGIIFVDAFIVTSENVETDFVVVLGLSRALMTLAIIDLHSRILPLRKSRCAFILAVALSFTSGVLVTDVYASWEADLVRWKCNKQPKFWDYIGAFVAALIGTSIALFLGPSVEKCLQPCITTPIGSVTKWANKRSSETTSPGGGESCCQELKSQAARCCSDLCAVCKSAPLAFVLEKISWTAAYSFLYMHGLFYGSTSGAHRYQKT
jgi:hypothetical protein